MSQELKRALPRLTKQRKAIFTALQGDTSHPTAEEIYLRVKHELPHISLATVYRNLKRMAQEGLIQEIPTPHGPARYDPHTRPHYHFLCDGCGRVRDVKLPLQNHFHRELARQGYQVRTHEILFRGLCPKCRSQVTS
jgi:Fur family ferric uptake transcriptional regulator/Fur family peroxide stress response transcriptional regulator